MISEKWIGMSLEMRYMVWNDVFEVKIISVNDLEINFENFQVLYQLLVL
jgi:hypothetical protein